MEGWGGRGGIGRDGGRGGMGRDGGDGGWGRGDGGEEMKVINEHESL